MPKLTKLENHSTYNESIRVYPAGDTLTCVPHGPTYNITVLYKDKNGPPLSENKECHNKKLRRKLGRKEEVE